MSCFISNRSFAGMVHTNNRFRGWGSRLHALPPWPETLYLVDNALSTRPVMRIWAPPYPTTIDGPVVRSHCY